MEMEQKKLFGNYTPTNARISSLITTRDMNITEAINNIQDVLQSVGVSKLDTHYPRENNLEDGWYFVLEGVIHPQSYIYSRKALDEILSEAKKALFVYNVNAMSKLPARIDEYTDIPEEMRADMVIFKVESGKITRKKYIEIDGEGHRMPIKRQSNFDFAKAVLRDKIKDYILKDELQRFPATTRTGKKLFDDVLAYLGWWSNQKQ